MFYHAKTKSLKSEWLFGLFSSILIMFGCFILFDLYVPIKRVLIGDHLNFSGLLVFVKFKQHLLS